MRSVAFHPEAPAELIAAARYYEEQAENLGLELISAVERTYQRLTSFRTAVIRSDLGSAAFLFPASRTGMSTGPSQIASLLPRSLMSGVGPAIGGPELERRAAQQGAAADVAQRVPIALW